MYKYKRGISDINLAKNMQFVLADGKSVCLNLSAMLEARKIYQGLYIKGSRVLVENVLEKIEIEGHFYRVGSLNTAKNKISPDEYILGLDLDKNIFEYDVNGLKYKKRLCFDIENSDTLLINYEISNSLDKEVKFTVIPFVTYRELFSSKTANMLKFNHIDSDSGTFMNLSITNKDNLYIKSDKLKWSKTSNYLNNVEHEYVTKDYNKKVYTEDLYIPGNFSIDVAPMETLNVTVYVGTSEAYIDEIEKKGNSKVFEFYDKENESVTCEIEDEFVELKDLTIAMKNTYLNNFSADTVPFLHYEKKSLTDNQVVLSMIDAVRAVEGRYLCLNKLDTAKEMLTDIMEKLDNLDYESIKDEAVLKNLLLLNFWLIESINRMLQKDNSANTFFDFIKKSIYEVQRLDSLKELVYKDIELLSLYYNAIRIYENSLSELKQEDTTAYEMQEYILDLVNDKFWLEDKRILKSNLDEKEDCVAKISMIYALSLSYPLLTNELGIKILDTIFKELYTPYGLREISKFSSASDGLIYPKYMAHFVKANLRQNGVTRASQKLAYNLVKELLQDISKHISGGVRKIYSEKGVLVDSTGYDILTNAELIRLYNMLT